MVVHIYNPSSWEGEAGGLKIQGQLMVINKRSDFNTTFYIIGLD
jgi:hypothetical protein